MNEAIDFIQVQMDAISKSQERVAHTLSVLGEVHNSLLKESAPFSAITKLNREVSSVKKYAKVLEVQHDALTAERVINRVCKKWSPVEEAAYNVFDEIVRKEGFDVNVERETLDEAWDMAFAEETERAKTRDTAFEEEEEALREAFDKAWDTAIDEIFNLT